MAMGTNDIIMEGLKTAEQIAAEQKSTYIAAVIRERDGYAARLKGLEDEGRSDTADLRATLKSQIQACNDELAAQGEAREPRSKIAK